MTSGAAFGPLSQKVETEMLKASEVATELRRIADALDKEPELIIDPYLSINAHSDREQFLALAKIMPRPMTKGIDFPGTSYEDFKLEHSFWRIKIARNAYCSIVTPAIPAVYECPPIFSPEEEAEMEEK
jgi:hypothetical protein